MIYDYDTKGIGVEAKRNPRDLLTPVSNRIFDSGRPADVVGGTPVTNDASPGGGLARRLAGYEEGQGSATSSPNLGANRSSPLGSPVRAPGAAQGTFLVVFAPVLKVVVRIASPMRMARLASPRRLARLANPRRFVGRTPRVSLNLLGCEVMEIK
jgi:hypothetical protein